ncbi:hypothetical protein [Leptospira alstonii]|nr:hypothetical protein [Leptospira alstonii]
MASDMLNEIVMNSGLKFAIASFVIEKEAHYFLREANNVIEKVKIDISHLIKSASIAILHIEDHEAQMVIDLSADVDDGEAYTIALAVSRKLNMASDDKKATYFFKNLCQDGIILSTEALLNKWANKNNIDSVILKSIIVKIEKCAKYSPPKDSEYFSWWKNIRESFP